MKRLLWRIRDVTNRHKLLFAIAAYLIILAMLSGSLYALMKIKPTRDGIATSDTSRRQP
jgi:hypothetical protein